MSRPLQAFLVLLLAATAYVADAQTCNRNASGPDQLTLVIPQGGSDFDIGWQNEYHDFVVPGGGRIEVCLNDCDTTSDPVCTVEGYAAGQSAAGRGFLPPIPIAIGTTATCVVTTFREPFATGTANVLTGAIDVTANFSADVFVTGIGSANPSNVCPKCSGATAGASGTCNSGANQGLACVTDQVVAVQNAADSPYAVSRDCPPSGTPYSTQFSVGVTTGTATQNGLCPGQTTANDCGSGNTCNLGTCSGAGNGGIRQACCSNNNTKSCFADPVARSGAAGAPTPLFPNATYPKTGTGTIAGVFCAPAVGGALGSIVNGAVGLPGPGAFILPVNAQWSLDPSPVTTTSTTTTVSTSTTTTTIGCASDAACDDADPCTSDVCQSSGACTNAPLTGAAAVACRVDDVDPVALCGETVDAGLVDVINPLLDKARTALDQIDGAPRKKAKRLKAAAKRALAAVLKKTGKAAKKQVISADCKTAITAAVSDLQHGLGGL